MGSILFTKDFTMNVIITITTQKVRWIKGFSLKGIFYMKPRMQCVLIWIRTVYL